VNIAKRKKIVLLGMMSRMPVAGVVWQTVHYLIGLRRLGYDVYYVEAHARTPTMLMRSPQDDGALRAAEFIDGVMRRFDFAGRWAFHALHEGAGARLFGLSDVELRDLYTSAALIINLHGGTKPRAEMAESGRLIYLETDPVQLQIELHEQNREAIEFLKPHVAFFTFGENYGRRGCGLPVSEQFRFKPTRQPVVIDLWRGHEQPPGPAFTTIGNWEQNWRTIEFRGEVYHWSKHLEFMKFLDLPDKTGVRFELALGSVTEEAARMLRSHGWEVRDAMSFSMDPDAYRRYIAASRGEFTVAKDQNVRLRSGWFSDRSATYLAAGRPVVTQDTGFGCALPTDEGLFAFSTMEQARDALHSIDADYARHSRAAATITQDYFAHDVVLKPLLREVGA
jgi:hypothetical protein